MKPMETEVGRLAANLTPPPAPAGGLGLWAGRKRHRNHRYRDPADLAVDVEQDAASAVQPACRPPPGLRANADPFACRLAEQLNRQRFESAPHILEWPCNVMGPARRAEHRRQRLAGNCPRPSHSRPRIARRPLSSPAPNRGRDRRIAAVRRIANAVALVK